MIAQEKIDEVKRLLSTGKYSQRKISRLTGVSRIVIYRIVTGKRKDRVERPKEEWEDDWRGKPYERCPICGAKVQLPCLTCIIRKALREAKPARFRKSPADSLTLDLQEQHRKRYEQVKAWREAQNDPTFAEIPDDWPFRRRPCRVRKINSVDVSGNDFPEKQKIKSSNQETNREVSDYSVQKRKPK